jgi:hypothetical protein
VFLNAELNEGLNFHLNAEITSYLNQCQSLQDKCLNAKFNSRMIIEFAFSRDGKAEPSICC